MASLKDLFTTNCKPIITIKQLQDLERFTATYEVRDSNALALNSPMLGVNKCYFYPKDADAVFAIFDIDKHIFMQHIKVCPGVDKHLNVASNEFNILVIWLIYLIKHATSISKPAAYNGCINLLKLLHYKFFTGKVAQQFQFGAKEPVMQATIDMLSAKSDIKNPETDTWKKLIYKHCVATLDNNPIYNNTFNNFAPDSAIAKSISDIHTRLCRKIVLVSEAYYECNKKGISYTSSSLMFDDAETGDKKIGDLKGTLDLAINRICTAVLNVNEFINVEMAELAAKLTSNIRKDNVIDILTIFSNMATQQVKEQRTKEIGSDRQKQPLYIGYITLIEEIVQKTYRRAALTGVDCDSNVAVLNVAKNTYSASRVIDRDILIIKNSIDKFLENTRYTRQGTIVSLRLAFILYIMLMSFKYK